MNSRLIHSLWSWLPFLRKHTTVDLRMRLTNLFMRAGEGDESLGGEELFIMKRMLEFSHMRSEDVMIPRADIIAVEEKTDISHLAHIFKTCGYSRLPVYREILDQPQGIIHIKDIVGVLADQTMEISLNCLLRPLIFVPASMLALDLLLRMQTTRSHTALVVDEYGGTYGLVTIDNLISEVIGEIDEAEDDTDLAFIEREHGVLEASARLSVQLLEQRFDVILQKEGEDADTLGGFVFALAGRIPERGEVITHESGIEFEVYDADARCIKTFRIRKVFSSNDDAA